MKHANQYTKVPQQKRQEFSERERQIVRRLFAAMKIMYGALFTANLDTVEDQEAWELSWMASFQGKIPEIIAKALKHCLETNKTPFTRGHFQEAYQSLRPRKMYQRNRDALALPSKTREERKAIAAEKMQEVKAAIGPAPKMERLKHKGPAPDREFFKAAGYTNLDYPNGEPNKLGWLPFNDSEKGDDREEKKEAVE